VQNISVRKIVMPLVVLLCGALVLYPIGFLINESLNVGDPSVFPPEEYGFDNYTNLVDDSRALTNTLFVSCMATVLAVLFGFLQAWILLGNSVGTPDYYLMSTYAFFAFQNNDYGVGAAISLVTVVILFSVTFFYIRQMVKIGEVAR